MGKPYSIPDKLVAVVRPKSTFTQLYTNKQFRCRPAFVTDYYAAYMLKKARKWGGLHTRSHNAGSSTPALFDEILLPNDPLTSLRVVGFEHRSNGGVVFKVITDQGWLVDLREPEFMEAAITGTIVEGLLSGEFVWSRGINQMRLVLVGGQTYNERLKYRNGV